ncbi:tripartite tricarboxylate transporter permease [Actinoalloteichus hoggarensis]|uniref:tripartite tricarboxylate transporter permease n=1 Tax=Actinoalloteichus hoggarensis TaxID=1470176 RepID=UPI0035DD42A0
MYLGDILLLITSIPLVGLFVKILRVRPTILAPITVLITLVGAYTVCNDPFDIILVIVFGTWGYRRRSAASIPAARAGVRPRLAAGGLVASVAADLRRRPDRLRDATDLRNAARGLRGGGPAARDSGVDQAAPRRPRTGGGSRSGRRARLTRGPRAASNAARGAALGGRAGVAVDGRSPGLRFRWSRRLRRPRRS